MKLYVEERDTYVIGKRELVQKFGIDTMDVLSIELSISTDFETVKLTVHRKQREHVL